jgi:hypothetical protein
VRGAASVARSRAACPAAAMTCSGLLDSKRLVHVIPRWRGWAVRGMALTGRPGLRTAELLRMRGERRRARR